MLFTGRGVCLIMAMAADTCWVGHFLVEPGIFVSHHVFLCRTWQFWVEPGFLCQSTVIMT